MKKISIITVVLNNQNSFSITMNSIIHQKYLYEWIVIDGGSVDGTLNIIKDNDMYIDYWISEPDIGIYDAMNKGLEKVTGEGIIFLNAGDYFVGDVLQKLNTIPCFLPVKTHNVFGKIVNINIKSYKRGIPNCHQGIVFDNQKIRYDLKYKIAADYDFFLRHHYQSSKIKFNKTNGYVYYDNNGFSQQNFKLRDSEIADIIKKNFGIYHYVIFVILAKIKGTIKTILRERKVWN